MGEGGDKYDDAEAWADFTGEIDAEHARKRLAELAVPSPQDVIESAEEKPTPEPPRTWAPGIVYDLHTGKPRN